ncbi:MAG: hypothetical protein ACRDU8_11135 [Egibacteraceae bacterium]
MLTILRRDAKIRVVAVITAALAGAGPAMAAFDAVNAHKVDGKHAVGATTNLNARKKRLVATNAHGRLPNNIIKKAPDADQVDGYHPRR